MNESDRFSFVVVVVVNAASSSSSSSPVGLRSAKREKCSQSGHNNGSSPASWSHLTV